MQAFFHRRTGFARFWMLEPACLQTRTLPGSAGLQFSVVGKPGDFFLAPVLAFHFLPEDKKTVAQCWLLLRPALLRLSTFGDGGRCSSWPGFWPLARGFPRAAVHCI
jgi:hypothetical protein